MSIKAIETIYNGYKFRSRTEARWAVFFDELFIRYEYEKEGFKLDNGICYLPDFYLPDFDMFLEIKGIQPSRKELLKIALLQKELNIKCSLLWGTPGIPFVVLKKSLGKFLEWVPCPYMIISSEGFAHINSDIDKINVTILGGEPDIINLRYVQDYLRIEAFAE